MQVQPSLFDIFRTLFRLGITAYGGPAMLPHVREVVVGRRQWLTPEEFKLGISLCQAIPGATLMQLAAFVGFRLGGMPGALIGFVGFALPCVLLMTGLAAVYHAYQDMRFTHAVMTGLSLIVLAIILLAVIDFGRKYVGDVRKALLSLAAAGLFLAGIGPGWIIAGAALAGLVLFNGEDAAPSGAPNRNGVLRTALILAALAVGWLAVIFFLDRPLFDLSISMAKIDLLAFGGYGAFPVMYHEVVDVRGWMSASTFMDGMALAQITPGPILLASVFVGYHLMGLLGAATGAIWVFTPSFFILLAALPFCDNLLVSRPFRRALTGILSTLGGLILAVGVTLARVTDWTPLKLAVWAVAVLALWRKIDPLWVVLAGAGAGLLLF